MKDAFHRVAKSRRAQAMVVVFVYLCIIFLVAISIQTYAQNMHRLVIRSLNHLRALNAAEAGLVAKLDNMGDTLFSGGSPSTAGMAFSFPDTAAIGTLVDPGLTPENAVSVAVANLGGGNYQVTSTVSNWRTGAAPEDIIMRTNFPSPFGEYDTVAIRSRLYDYDNSAFRIVLEDDLLWDSVINNATVDENITMQGPQDTGAQFRSLISSGDISSQWVDLNRFEWPSMWIHSLETEQRINMGAANPGFWGAGKKVYDIAEGFDTACEPGDVVRISTRGGMKLEQCAAAYDARVAGVMSETPTLLLGGEDGKAPLALNGIVPCNVVAENGPIQRGDLLVSSSRPGHAMRADPGKLKPGMLVGKAMQPLNEEAGTIYVLVNKR